MIFAVNQSDLDNCWHVELTVPDVYPPWNCALGVYNHPIESNLVKAHQKRNDWNLNTKGTLEKRTTDLDQPASLGFHWCTGNVWKCTPDGYCKINSNRPCQSRGWVACKLGAPQGGLHNQKLLFERGSDLKTIVAGSARLCEYFVLIHQYWPILDDFLWCFFVFLFWVFPVKGDSYLGCVFILTITYPFWGEAVAFRHRCARWQNFPVATEVADSWAGTSTFDH